MGSQDSNVFMDFILQSHDNTGLVQQQKKCYYIHSLKFTTASTRNFLRQLSQSQLNWWYHISNKSTNDFISTLKIRDHSFKISANFHDFWPLPPYHRHSSKMLMKGIFDPYVLWPFDHRYMGTPLPPKTCWHLKWMVPYGKVQTRHSYVMNTWIISSLGWVNYSREETICRNTVDVNFTFYRYSA